MLDYRLWAYWKFFFSLSWITIPQVQKISAIRTKNILSWVLFVYSMQILYRCGDRQFLTTLMILRCHNWIVKSTHFLAWSVFCCIFFISKCSLQQILLAVWAFPRALNFLPGLIPTLLPFLGAGFLSFDVFPFPSISSFSGVSSHLPGL